MKRKGVIKKVNLIKLVLLCQWVSYIDCSPAGQVVTIQQGELKGRVSQSRENRLFVEFFGIPYAKKPERFKVAGSAPKWKGILDASKKASPCFHFDPYLNQNIGSENCLFLNVHTPKTHTNYYLKNMPVMVAIHGGQFVSASGHLLGAKYFMDHNVVFVTFNYRLGVFGFFSTNDEDSVANLGLKDQVLALQWVQKNIHLFGGNPNEVTLMGYNAGAAFVSYHMLSPMSKGLFHKAISQSGNAVCPWAIVYDVEEIRERFAANIGCDDDNITDSLTLMECMKTKTSSQIERARIKLSGVLDDPLTPFGPVVEHWMRSYPEKPVFLPHYPQNLLFGDSFNGSVVPWLTGANNFDGIDRKLGEWMKFPDKVEFSYDLFAPIYFNYGKKVFKNSSDVSKKVREFYFKSDEISDKNKPSLVDALTDRNYLQCTKNAVVEYTKHADVFLYYFSYVGGVSFAEDWKLQPEFNMSGVLHSDELQYLFDLNDLGNFPLIRRKFREKSLQFSKALVNLWINFATSGTPTSDWKAVPKDQSRNDALDWYEIGNGSRKMMKEPFTERINFWNSLDLDPLKELPTIKPRPTKSLRKATKMVTDKSNNEDTNNEDIVYVDAEGDDDGTGGLFKII